MHISLLKKLLHAQAKLPTTAGMRALQDRQRLLGISWR
jgi:hypothetical protein